MLASVPHLYWQEFGATTGYPWYGHYNIGLESLPATNKTVSRSGGEWNSL